MLNSRLLSQEVSGGASVFTRARLVSSVAAALVALSGAQAMGQEQQRTGGYNLQLEEVVVTAQKREENYMSVPVTVNAFTAQDMLNTGAITIQDIDDFIPGFEVSEGGSTQVGITMRGVSSPNISSGGDPSTATFYDGSYMPRAVTSIPFTDIARTEILKGPQGTLFGRNATAGVINIVPNNPGDEFEAFVKTRLGNHNLVRVEGMVNAPITDNVALRANVFSHQRDGITENVGIGGDIRDEKFFAMRASLLWTLSDQTDLQLSADIEDRDEQPRQAIGVGKYAFQGSTNPYSGKAANDVVGQEETREMYGVALKLNHEFNDELSMFGVLSYRDWDTTNLEDEDGTEDPRRYFDTNNIEESNILYSELRFNYVTDRINLISGVNYSSEEVYQRTDIDTKADSYMQFLTGVLGPEFGIPVDLDDHIWDLFPAPDFDDGFYLFVSESAGGIAVLPPSSAGELVTETMDNTGDFTNWGVFADLTYQLTDTLSVAGGLRYSADEKDYSWQTFASNIDWPFAPFILNYDPALTGADPADYLNKFSDSESWSKVTGRLVANWQISDTAMTYLSYATGYKSGGYDGQSFASFVTGPFDPEDMANIELGLKGDFFDNRVRLEVAVFHQELDGKQTQRTTKDGPDDPTASPSVVSSDEETDGIELIVQWNVLENLRLTGLTTYRDTENISDEYYNGAGELKGGDAESGNTSNDYTLRFDWTPEIPIGFLLVHVDYVFIEDTGEFSDDAVFFEGPWYFQDKKRLSARLAWESDDASIEVALWGKNLLDEEYAGNPGGFVADELGAAYTSIEDPLTYGVDLRYAF
ncbi:MAG: iron complex outermembrane receptor protein [Halioglobus sp.]|jgi:iron complex outermembrane receptor protein